MLWVRRAGKGELRIENGELSVKEQTYEKMDFVHNIDYSSWTMGRGNPLLEGSD